MFKQIPKYLKNYLFPSLGTLNKNYSYLQFTSMKIVPAFYIIIKNIINKKNKKEYNSNRKFIWKFCLWFSIDL